MFGPTFGAADARKRGTQRGVGLCGTRLARAAAPPRSAMET
jgi:hypothetical protein